MESNNNITRTLEIVVISGENLSTNNGKPVKNKVFTVVRADTDRYAMTNASREGGCNPRWKEKVALELPVHVKFITAEVYCSGRVLVGTARIPVSDFIGDYVPETHLHCLSYRLRDANGHRNGIINFSVRVKVPEMSRPAPEYYSCSQSGVAAAIGIPAWRTCHAS